MLKFHVREILAMDQDAVWDVIPHSKLSDKILLTYDNGETREEFSRHTIFSQYVWAFHRQYPKTQLLPCHHIGNRIMDKNVYLDLMSKAYFQCYYDNEELGVSRELLMLILYEITNKVNNMIVGKHLSAYVTTFTILDLLNIMDHPRIKEAYMALSPPGTPQLTSIEDVYTVIADVLKNDSTMIKNSLAFAVRSGLVDMNQAKQMTGPRGRPTDTDNYVFDRTPILPSFTHGLVEIVDCLTESRSAAKAQFYQKGPMEQSEYLQRSVQLLSMTLKNLHMTDCKSTGFIRMTVDKKNGKNLLGKRMICDDGTQKFIRPEMINSLHGKTVKLRSIIKCQHPDEVGVCAGCFGALALSIPHGTNLGYTSASTLLGVVCQDILSTKHLVISADGTVIEVTDTMGNWIKYGTKPNTFNLASILKKSKVNFVIPKEAGFNLNDVVYVDDVSVLQKHLITQFNSLVFEKDLGKGITEYHEIQLFLDNNAAHLTFEALEYIKAVGYSISPSDEFLISLDTWDFSKPFFEIPTKQYSTIDFMKSVDRAITGSASVGSKNVVGSRIVDYNTPEEALIFLFNLINSKLSVSLSHIETIIYVLMCADPDNNDYSLPRKGAPNKLVPFNKIMKNRSMSAFLAFERQYKPLITPSTYMIKNRPPHPLDPIFIPSTVPVIYN